ncbi:MBL fold metallo-hydrolase [Marinilongibacter aquaticus]|uniref:AVAST type 1 anti-phage system MBL fold metallo-hydrolase Avs1a n=1 Tax=Marinilongibacter aquaticus TaxID=2975157 RepID=UPI0021BDD9BB|nr:AVAST type 1 anti-phage system MBL fold metallo-hydrolase Avs1a [Marinilongibacter aquaticus]UBM59570.1 MBL fold metallo-hydrolase [Marinilongibacter aquaticus]
MNVYVTVYPAKNGDCFLISFSENEQIQKHLLIDCGYTDTVKAYLKNDLSKIGEEGGVLEKMILTHIDADHIQGAIRLLKENNVSKFIEIKEIWHNTFRHLSDKKQISLDKSQKRILDQLIRRGYPVRENEIKGEQEISAEQGTTVGALILQGKYSWNSDFEGNAISTDFHKKITIGENEELVLLSPNKRKLEQLKSFWRDELYRYGVSYDGGNSELYDDAFEMFMSWEKDTSIKQSVKISAEKETFQDLLQKPFKEDTTVTNGSSIAFILKIQEKNLLFLADAHPDLIVQSLKEYKKDGIIKFDLIKVSHHGSFNNISKDLLELVDSPKYLISTNGGRHNHPDKETIAHIINRQTNFHREIYFNYITDNSKYFDRADWKKKYNYSIHYLNQAPYNLSL